MAATLGLKLCGRLTGLVRSSCFVKDSALAAVPVTYQQQREKKKKAGGSSKNKRVKTKNKKTALTRGHGQFVYQGETLALQRRLIWYPGENVGIQKNGMLYSLRDGNVVISCEKLNPYPDSPLYKPVNEYGHNIYKKFINVFPIPVRAKFKRVF